MSAVIERSFRVLEALSNHPLGQPLSSLAADLEIPLSATHRLLTELIRCGYVRQDPRDGHYFLTIKLVSLGLSYLSNSGVVDVAQPLLDQLASTCGELVRLGVVDDDQLIFVAKAQGATHGLRYDPDMGRSVPLSCSAAGHAWLATMNEDDAMALVAKKGLAKREQYGPRAPTTIKGVMAMVKATRERGFSLINEVFAPGMTAMAAAVVNPQGVAVGVITVAGPAVRLTEERMLTLGPVLRDTAQEIAHASHASALFKRRK